MATSRDEERPSRAFRKTKRFKNEAKALGLQVRALRQERKWTLQEASDRMSIDLKHLQKIESGLLNVTLVTVVRIAEGLGEEIAALFPPSDTPQSRE